MSARFSFRARYVRQHPDPNIDNSKIWNLTVNTLDIPEGLPFFNPRDQRLDRRMYRTVHEHLRGDFGEPLFYQMNRGITIAADKVLIKRSANALETKVSLIFSGDEQGIVDGGHTYAIICENNSVDIGPFKHFPAYRDASHGFLRGAGGQPTVVYVENPVTGRTQIDGQESSFSEAALRAVLGADWKQVLETGYPDRPTSDEIVLLLYASHALVQFVKVQVHTGLPPSVVHEMARGLNTGMQVTNSTMADFEGRYDWIKDELRGMPYFSEIAFRQNAPGCVAIEDVIRMLEAFNVIDFPVGCTEHPIYAASEVKKTVGRYLSDITKYQSLRPILREILQLHDIICFEAWELWRGNKSGRSGRAPMIFNSKARDDHFFPFIDRYRGLPLYDGTLFPIFAAFRSRVQIEDGKAKWKNSFDDVLSVWRKIGLDLLKATYRTAHDKGGAISAVARDRNLWEIVHGKVLNA